tara:strand:+ start:286 stop:960 length:675 start_codon:yes stop_codon:yes gene_type:complete
MNEESKGIIKDLKSNQKYFININNYSKTIGKLKPITYYDIGNDDLINNLMKWRNENISAYLNQEYATFEGTRKWLTKFVLDNPSKLLFIVYSQNFEPIGHMGIADGLKTNSFFELDNIVRGEKNGEKGIMTLALYDLITWIFLFSECDRVYLRVFSDNKRAINMYSRLKFNEKRKFALEKSFSKNNVIQYNILNDKHAEGKYFSYMELDKNDHFLNYKNIKIRD